MEKKRVALVILFSYLINIWSVSASNEIALKSRRFTPAKGITAAANGDCKVDFLDFRIMALHWMWEE